jgi:hypothetical protein
VLYLDPIHGSFSSTRHTLVLELIGKTTVLIEKPFWKSELENIGNTMV